VDAGGALILRRAGSAVFAMLFALPWSSACIDDPPDPTTCPGVAKSAPACGAQVSALSAPGCAPSVLSCMRSTCECQANECPPDRAACFPSGDCPPAVTTSAGKSATCTRIDPTRGGLAAGCSCGCTECLAVCDGKGPAFAGLLPPSSDAPALLHVDLPGRLPAKGRLGIYVRVRGDTAAPIPIVVLRGAAPVALFPLSIGSTASFIELVVGGASGPEWSSADAAPTSLELKPFGNKFGIEIDCIVPFVLPE
jgi:hypothetical protein